MHLVLWVNTFGCQETCRDYWWFWEIVFSVNTFWMLKIQKETNVLGLSEYGPRVHWGLMENASSCKWEHLNSGLTQVRSDYSKAIFKPGLNDPQDFVIVLFFLFLLSATFSWLFVLSSNFLGLHLCAIFHFSLYCCPLNSCQNFVILQTVYSNIIHLSFLRTKILCAPENPI